jgi:predicted Mrr-cat superfamily restriction endonuclease
VEARAAAEMESIRLAEEARLESIQMETEKLRILEETRLAAEVERIRIEQEIRVA